MQPENIQRSEMGKSFLMYGCTLPFLPFPPQAFGVLIREEKGMLSTGTPESALVRLPVGFKDSDHAPAIYVSLLVGQTFLGS